MKNKNFQYRPEIDGLRALAVLSVVFFHAGLGFPGGFVGVDVFFVLSGYLITSILVKELETGTFQFMGFWARRVRRILPASILVCVTTLVLGYFILLPEEFRRLGISSAVQSLFSSNIYFWKYVNYFSGSAEEMPLLHTWSLAVEEQYYFIFPFVLAGCFATALLRSRNRIFCVLALLFGLSFFASLLAVKQIPGAAFYLLPFRAWEMLAGSLLALSPAAIVPRSRIMREILSYVGLCLILVPIFLYTKQTQFPGLAALPPVLGTVIIIWANGRIFQALDNEHVLTSIGRVLALRPLVFVGLISYSLYLWHWPLFAFAKYWTFNKLTIGHSFFIISLSFILAIVSWHYVETPFRLKKFLVSNRSIIWAGVCASLMLFITGSLVWRSSGLPSRYSPEILELAKVDSVNKNNVAIEAIITDQVPQFGVSNTEGYVDLLVWGDSHARTYIPAFEKIANVNNLSGRAITYSATLPLLNYDGQLRQGLDENANEWSVATLDYIKRHNIPKVVLVGYWTNPDFNADYRMAESLWNTILAIRNTGARVWVVLSAPNHELEVPRALVFEQLGRLTGSDWQRKPHEHYEQQTHIMRVMENNDDNGAVFVDIAPLFEIKNEDGSFIYKVTKEGRSIYYDKHHLKKWFVLDEIYLELAKYFSRK